MPTTVIKLYVFDLDGTLSDCSHRLHYIQGSSQDWTQFFEKCTDDPPIVSMIELLRILSLHGEILILTGRGAGYRPQTVQWLELHQVQHKYLLMRGEKDYRPDVTVKLELLRQFLTYKGREELETIYQVELVVDDRHHVVDAFRNEGFTVLQCAPHEGSSDVSKRMEAGQHMQELPE